MARNAKSGSQAELQLILLPACERCCYSAWSRRSCQNLTVDFREVPYVDTSGLAVLVEILKAARTQGKTFHLSGLSERPRYLAGSDAAPASVP